MLWWLPMGIACMNSLFERSSKHTWLFSVSQTQHYTQSLQPRHLAHRRGGDYCIAVIWRQRTGAVALAILFLAASHYVGLAFRPRLHRAMASPRILLANVPATVVFDLEAKSPLYSLFLEALHGRATMPAFHWDGKFKQEFVDDLDVLQRPSYLLYSVQQWLTLVLGLITAAIAVILVALMMQLCSSTTSAGLGGVALVNLSTLMSVVIVWTKLETPIGAVARIRQFSFEIPREPEQVQTIPLPEGWPERGAVDFRT